MNFLKSLLCKFKLIFLFVVICPLAGFSEDIQPDYQRLRFEFAAKEGFNPLAISMKEEKLKNEALEHFRKDEIGEGLNKFKEIIDIYPYSLETHKMTVIVCEKTLPRIKDEMSKEPLVVLKKEHEQAYNGIIKSIVRNNNGESPKQAFKVITISEEYATLDYLGLEVKSQRLLNVAGIPYDVLEAEDKKGNKKDIYFDVSTLFTAYEKLRQKP